MKVNKNTSKKDKLFLQQVQTFRISLCDLKPNLKLLFFWKNIPHSVSLPPLFVLSCLSFLVSHIPSILFRPSCRGQECSYSGFSCRVAYYLSLWGTSNTLPGLGANSLCQHLLSLPPSSAPLFFSLLFFPRSAWPSNMLLASTLLWMKKAF